MAQLTLRILEASGFVTVGREITAQENDNTLIQLKAEIDVVSEVVNTLGAHVQNTDNFLAYGTANQVAASDIKRVIDDIPLPSVGAVGDTLRVNSGETAYEVSENAYIYAKAEDTSDTTSIVGADTATSINTTLTEVQGAYMDVSANCSFINNSSQTKLVHVTAQISCFNSSAGDADLELILEVDSVQQAGRCTAYNAGGTKHIILYWSGIVSMAPGNVAEFKYINVSSTDDIRTKQIQIIAKSIN